MFQQVTILIFLGSFAFGNAYYSDNPQTVHDINGRAFEQKILEQIEKMRYLLKYGNPEEGIAPMDPFFLSNFAFDYIFPAESNLNGYLAQTLFHNISDFNVTFIEFDTFQARLKLSLVFPKLLIEGDYRLTGALFASPLAAEGKFVSDTTDLKLDVMIHLGSNLFHSQIKELTAFFLMGYDTITYSNTLTKEENGQLDNEYMSNMMYRIRDEMFPELLETLRLVGTDIIYELTLDEIIGCLIGSCGNYLRVFDQNNL